MNKSVIIVYLILFMALIMPDSANAQIMNIDLNAGLEGACTANDASGQNLFDDRNGDPNSSSLCGGSGNGIFARFFCVLETTLGLIIASTFCAVRNAWMAPFAAMMMLLMAVTGISFVLGIIQFTVKEVSVIIFKMALVTMFVTNADVALNIAFALYIGLMKATVHIMTDGFSNLVAGGVGAAAPYVESAAGFANKIAAGVGSGNPFNEADSFIDGMGEMMFSGNNNSVTIDEQCSVLGLLGGLLLAMPFVAVVIFMGVIAFLGFFARAAYGYIYALVMVTFLVAAMPIFVSFALFKSTVDVFEHWLKYIGSNVIQIFIVFAIMAFASMIDIASFFSQINALIKPLPETSVSLGGSAFEINITGCSVCEPNFYTSAGGGAPYTDTSGGIPHLVNGNECASQTPMAWGEVIKNTALLKFLLLNGAALLILTVVMDQFMKVGPDLARMLGGARLVQTIGGASASGGSGITSSLHRGTQNFEQGMENAYRQEDAGLVDAIRGGERQARMGEWVPRKNIDKGLLNQYDNKMDELENAIENTQDILNKGDEVTDEVRQEHINNLRRVQSEAEMLQRKVATDAIQQGASDRSYRQAIGGIPGRRTISKEINDESAGGKGESDHGQVVGARGMPGVGTRD